MKLNSKVVLIALGLLVLAGCGKKADEVAAVPDPITVSRVLLKEGLGAILFIFPQYPMEKREDWFTLINLSGAVNTDTLPRIPFADLSATLILNVPPGVYSARAASSIRGNPPYAGGNIEEVVIVKGTVAVMQVERNGDDPFPFNKTAIKKLSQPTWTLPNKESFMDYIAGISRTSSRG